jgi:hypothetical protein
MPHDSRADLGQAFCSYCGHPPTGRWRDRDHRVCMRCHLGVVLLAPPGAEPRSDDPFLIVDGKLAVQAVSRHAERVLSVDEPDGFGVPLEHLLISDDSESAGAAMAQLIERVLAGSQAPDTVKLRAVGDPDLRLHARISTCRHPLAALLVLAPR